MLCRSNEPICCIRPVGSEGSPHLAHRHFSHNVDQPFGVIGVDVGQYHEVEGLHSVAPQLLHQPLPVGSAINERVPTVPAVDEDRVTLAHVEDRHRAVGKPSLGQPHSDQQGDRSCECHMWGQSRPAQRAQTCAHHQSRSPRSELREMRANSCDGQNSVGQRCCEGDERIQPHHSDSSRHGCQRH